MDHTDHILIVDDDAEIRSLLTRYLERQGLRATAVGDGHAMWQALDAGAFDLLVLDLMLPGDDGLSLCRQLRATSDLPVLMLTARSDESDRILGLQAGADDYLPKPFSPRELLARIQVILRRTRGLPYNLPAPDETRLRFAGWEFDTLQGQLITPQGVASAIGTSEGQLLQAFLRHPNRVISAAQLSDLLEGLPTEAPQGSVDGQVERLRQRLGDDPRSPALIKTVRGEGYVFSAKVEGARP